MHTLEICKQRQEMIRAFVRRTLYRYEERKSNERASCHDEGRG